MDIEIFLIFGAVGVFVAYAVGYRMGYAQGIKTGALVGWIDAKGRYVEKID